MTNATTCRFHSFLLFLFSVFFRFFEHHQTPRTAPQGGRLQGWESVCWGVLGIPSLEIFKFPISKSWILKLSILKYPNSKFPSFRFPTVSNLQMSKFEKYCSNSELSNSLNYDSDFMFHISIFNFPKFQITKFQKVTHTYLPNKSEFLILGYMTIICFKDVPINFLVLFEVFWWQIRGLRVRIWSHFWSFQKCSTKYCNRSEIINSPFLDI